jgi:hypothetical protein
VFAEHKHYGIRTITIETSQVILVITVYLLGIMHTHPDRTHLLSDSNQSSSVAPPVRPGNRTSQDDAARKERINKDLVALLNMPYSADSSCSVQGIGLYTHATVPRPLGEVHGPKATGAVFLPIGGPNPLPETAVQLRPPIDKEIQTVWETVEGTVNEEAKHIARSNLSTEQLKERYGALGVPDENPDVLSPAQNDKRVQQWKEYLQELARIAQPSEDVAMGGTESGKSPTKSHHHSH